ncbi:MAG: aminotransferase class IV [Sulfurovum sp.]|nr:aminotransferase class IV [Sulfurovum sp.]
MSQDSLALLLETIRIEDGKVYNLSYHQQRCNQSRQILFGSTNILELSSKIKAPKEGLYRCRILYGECLNSIEYIPYVPKKIHSLKIVSSDLQYAYKYANRDGLNALLNSHCNVDEVIIEQEGFLTDTTIANIAFYDGKRWITPKNPLLRGTMREKLINEGLLEAKNIRKDELNKYTHVALMNAMIGFTILNHFNIHQ